MLVKTSLLSLLLQQAVAVAQPLELVMLNDKSGLLPPEEKSAKDEGGKNAPPKSTLPAKKASAVSPTDRPSAATPANAPTRSSYVVKTGDNLDKIIAQNYPDSVIKTEVLKKELMALNPQAFSKNNPKMLLSGVTLQLPSATQLLGKQASNAGSTWSSEKTKLSQSGYTIYPPLQATAQTSEKRRNWVQYP